MKKWMLRKILKWLGYDCSIKMRNLYWSDRVDKINMIDLLVSYQRKQEEAILVTCDNNKKHYGQPGHYIQSVGR